MSFDPLISPLIQTVPRSVTYYCTTSCGILLSYVELDGETTTALLQKLPEFSMTLEFWAFLIFTYTIKTNILYLKPKFIILIMNI